MAGGVGSATLERVRAGDLPTIQALVDQSCARLGALVVKGVDPDDARQAAATELLEAARDFTPANHGAFEPYALARMRHRLGVLLYAERKRLGRVFPLSEADEQRIGVEMRTRFHAEVESPDLARALAKLSPRMRALLLRIYWQGLTSDEIAASRGVDPAAVRHARRRAEAMLRNALQAARNGASARKRAQALRAGDAPGPGARIRSDGRVDRA